MRRLSKPAKIAVYILLGALVVVICGGSVMLLWNYVLAEVTNVKTINFWQALGIFALSKILFGGFKGGRNGRVYKWKEMRQKWNNMSPEEKEKFKSEWQQRCGKWGYKPWKEEVGSQESPPEKNTTQTL